MSIQLVDQVHPARIVMPEKAFGWPLIEPLHAFPDDLLPIHAYFLWSMRTIPPTNAMAECHLTTKMKRAVKAQAAIFLNRCPK